MCPPFAHIIVLLCTTLSADYPLPMVSISSDVLQREHRPCNRHSPYRARLYSRHCPDHTFVRSGMLAYARRRVFR